MSCLHQAAVLIYHSVWFPEAVYNEDEWTLLRAYRIRYILSSRHSIKYRPRTQIFCTIMIEHGLQNINKQID